MSYRIRVSARARRDILQIVDLIARESSVAALRWHDGIQEAIQTVDQNPGRCTLVSNDDVLRLGLRRLLYGDYRVLFIVREEANSVEILHVRHGARLPLD